MSSQLKTVSESLFASYLDEYRYEWEYEPEFSGKAKRPDFRIRRNNVECLIDAKERSPIPLTAAPMHFDPIKGVRAKIKEGDEKFREFGDFLCGLAIYNNGDFNTRFSPWHIFGAMLGNPGIAAPINVNTGDVDHKSAQSVFLPRGGKMIRHYFPLEPHESTNTIGAIIVPSLYSIRNSEFDREVLREIDRRQNQIGRSLESPERAAICWDVGLTVPPTLKRIPRVVLCINPFARQFPDNIFDGPYDARWAMQDDLLQRIFAGSELANTEADPLVT